MKNYKFIIGLLGVFTPSLLMAQKNADKPNVIIILSDDAGYGDVSYTGNKDLKMPELKKLYSESICFDNFHTGTTSAPTRSGLMTGHHGNETGVWHTIGGRSLLSLDEYTLPEVFSDSGYATAMFGKWHLGDNYPYRPFDRGFDITLWHKGGGVTQTPDYWENNYFDDTYLRNDKPEKQEGYCTDIFFNETKRFVKKSRDKGKPFFCYLSLNAPHGPYIVDEKYTDMYRDNKNVANPAFYGMLTNIDENIGSLRAFLKKEGVDDNTIIIYFGDNGTAAGVVQSYAGVTSKGYNGGLRGKKGGVFEGGHRQAMLFYLPGEEKGKTVNELAAYTDIMPTLIDICGLTPKRDIDYHGQNIIEKPIAKDRVFVVDTQRKHDLAKDRTSCVMSGKWRLINGNQLYDIEADRGQMTNIADSHKDIVAKLQMEYDKWWDISSTRKDEMQYIPIRVKRGEMVEINCHDMQDTENNQSVWNQYMLRTDLRPHKNGFWAIDVKRKGKYDFKIYRWSPESGLAFNAAAPEGRPTPSDEPYKVGVVVDDIVKVDIFSGDKLLASTTNIDLNNEYIEIDNVKLDKGEQRLRIILTNRDGESCSSWFMQIK